MVAGRYVASDHRDEYTLKYYKARIGRARVINPLLPFIARSPSPNRWIRELDALTSVELQ